MRPACGSTGELPSFRAAYSEMARRYKPPRPSRGAASLRPQRKGWPAHALWAAANAWLVPACRIRRAASEDYLGGRVGVTWRKAAGRGKIRLRPGWRGALPDACKKGRHRRLRDGRCAAGGRARIGAPGLFGARRGARPVPATSFCRLTRPADPGPQSLGIRTIAGADRERARGHAPAPDIVEAKRAPRRIPAPCDRRSDHLCWADGRVRSLVTPSHRRRGDDGAQRLRKCDRL